MTVNYYTFVGSTGLLGTITGLSANTQYFYTITAFNGTTPGTTSAVQENTTAASTLGGNAIVFVGNSVFDINGLIAETAPGVTDS
jgi:hypothetical protein